MKMKEIELIELIKKVLPDNKYIGDDCAYLKDLGIVVSQDSLVENIHFSIKFATAKEIGYKSIIVNLSDIYASGATPKYLTISLSLPENIDKKWVKDFYLGINETCGKEIKVVGGDITGSDKIFISICAIGICKNKNISSRKNAKIGDFIIVSGEHGSSKAGLDLLFQNKKTPKKFINAHLKPILDKSFAENISKNVKRYAMMDTSDGLADALFKISKASDVQIETDFNLIPFDKSLKKLYPQNFKDIVLFGGEDYKLVASISPKDLNSINKNIYTIIGKVTKKGQKLKINNKIIDKKLMAEKSFDHFKKEQL